MRPQACSSSGSHGPPCGGRLCAQSMLMDFCKCGGDYIVRGLAPGVLPTITSKVYHVSQQESNTTGQCGILAKCLNTAQMRVKLSVVHPSWVVQQRPNCFQEHRQRLQPFMTNRSIVFQKFIDNRQC